MFYLLVERPFEQSVVQSPHHHKEQGQVAAAPRPVSVQIDPQAHLIAVLASIESWKRKRHNSAGRLLEGTGFCFGLQTQG